MSNSYPDQKAFQEMFKDVPDIDQYVLVQEIIPFLRKPVGSGSKQHQDGPNPPLSKSSVPSRKPVGGDRTKPTASTTKPQPQSSSRANRSAAPDLNKALPRIPNNATVPFIACDSQGKFDQRHKTPEGRAPQAPIGSNQRVELPPLAKAQLASLPSPAPKPASRPTTASPDSKGAPPLKRTGSGLSDFFKPSSSRPGSRRASLQDAAKNVGKWAKTKTEILSMNQAQRDSYVKGASRAHRVEAKRQADPSKRPLEQKKLIVEKQKARHPDESWGLGPLEASYEAQMQEREFRKRTAAAYQKKHEEECAAALLEGKSRPVTPEAANGSPPCGSLNSAEFDPKGKSRIMLTLTEKLALQVSKKLDAFKSDRKDSNCSDMDFGMTDSAPAGAIEFCGQIEGTLYYKQGCHMPSRTHLKQGLCEDCYQYKKGGDSRDSSATRRKKGHNPISPEDDAKGGELYIRLPAKKRLRKVRNTVYEDPGNPFDFGAIMPIDRPPSTSTGQEILTDEHTNDDDQWDSWDEDGPEPSPGADSKMYSRLSNPFDLVEINPFDPVEEANSTFSRRDTLKPSRPNRRSMSVDIGFMPARRSLKRNDLTSTDQDWPGDVPLLHTTHPSGTIFTTESKRDTKFYAFYDDLLAEYGAEKSVIYGSIDYRLMSVTY